MKLITAFLFLFAMLAPASTPVVVIAGDYATPESTDFRVFDASHVVRPGDRYIYDITSTETLTIELDPRLEWYTIGYDGDCPATAHQIVCTNSPHVWVAVHAGVGTGPIVTVVNGVGHRLRYEAPSVWVPLVRK